MSKKRLLVVGIVVADIAALVVLIVLFVLKISKTATLDISLVPNTAKVYINDTEYMGGAYKVFPEENATVVVRAEGFVDKTMNMDIRANEITRIYEYLMPNEDNLNYYAQNVEEAEKLARFSSEDAKEIVKSLQIKEILPIVDFQYGGLNGRSREITINETSECDEYFCLIAIGNFQSEEEVKELIRAKGYNPEDYKIKYEKR